MVGVIEDVMDKCMEEDTNLDEEPSTGVRDDFEELLKEVQSKLYPGCTKFSSRDFISKLMHLKTKNKWTNSPFDELLEVLQSSHPEGNKVPRKHYVAKKILKKIGLGYESIHVCKNDRATNHKALSLSERHNLEWFVLDSCQEVRGYMNEFKSKHPQDDVKTKFPKWFLEKWFDTQRGVTFDNNITSINTQYEWCKEDQFIFASQAKQVFYIREPSRGNPNNNHQWAVENVNHRKILDLPSLLDGRNENVQTVDNGLDLAEDLDVVHNNSSSNSVLVIDFVKYFQNKYVHVIEGETSTEVNPLTVPVDELSEAKTDYGDDDPDYHTDGNEIDTEDSEGEFD